MRILLKRLRSEKDGAVSVLFVLLFTTLMGITAMATDAGVLILERQHLSTVADAAALSASQYLPDDPAGAAAAADSYLEKNGILPEEGTINVAADNESIEIIVERTVEFAFAKVIGFSSTVVTSAARARTSYLSGVQGAAPLAVQQDTWSLGDEVQLKYGAGSGEEGWYGALALGGAGAANYEDNLTSGFPDWVRVGDKLPIQTGNMAGPTTRAVESRLSADSGTTYPDYNRNSERLIVIPVVDSLEGDAHNEVTVVGFAMFFLEDVEDHGDERATVYGRFVRYVAEGESLVASSDFGIRTTKLSE